ncbi:MAG: hypothetical protein BGO01_11550 [Armatimonadetes bacterium 55-13]|nr:MAG: hypothetical protein BGO01_11550 [Armatimonadetes bacterium 55-13]
MHSRNAKTVKCQLSGQEYKLDEAIPVDLIRDSLLKEIKEKNPDWDPHGYVSLSELNRLRMEHVDKMLQDEQEELFKLKAEVVNSLKQHELLVRNTDYEFQKNLSFGERLSDRLASFGGSWTFILAFGSVLVIWISINSWLAFAKPFDPYPFILLNLVLSCLAAIQAPVIMMSQNRQEARDLARGENDYKINLKAEIEIRAIDEKLDKLINDQWKHLLEIQQMQMEMIEELVKGGRKEPT